MVTQFFHEPASVLTPVCCNCQRERVGADDWREHVPVEGERLTHGICPTCLFVLYPDVAPLISGARG